MEALAWLAEIPEPFFHSAIELPDGRKGRALIDQRNFKQSQCIENRERIEMTPLKALLLSTLMLSGIVLWGAGIYSADAAGEHLSVNGYGVVSQEN